MFKTFGLLALVSAAGLAGYLMTSGLKERVRLLNDYLKMILLLKSHIQYFRQPLVPLFFQTAEKSNSNAYRMLSLCAGQLESREAGINDSWERAVEKTYGNAPLTDEDLRLMKYPGTFLGQTDAENQTVQFAYLEKRLEEQLTEAREISRTRGPLYLRVGFFGGIITALVLL